jgi:hypothetical protein
MNEIALEIAAVQLSAPPDGASLIDQLRHAFRNHIAYIDSYAESFVALVRGQLGADPGQQSTLEVLRWLAAQRTLMVLGITEPIPPVLRTAMHGWVGYIDEMIIDRIHHRDVDSEALVELAVITLIATLQTASSLDPAFDLPPPIAREIQAFRATQGQISRLR